jgi:hypothetical protein
MGMMCSCKHGLAVQGWLPMPRLLHALHLLRPKSSWLACCENDNLACKIQTSHAGLPAPGANPLLHWLTAHHAGHRGSPERKHGASGHRFGARTMRQHRSPVTQRMERWNRSLLIAKTGITHHRYRLTALA